MLTTITSPPCFRRIAHPLLSHGASKFIATIWRLRKFPKVPVRYDYESLSAMVLMFSWAKSQNGKIGVFQQPRRFLPRAALLTTPLSPNRVLERPGACTSTPPLTGPTHSCSKPRRVKESWPTTSRFQSDSCCLKLNTAQRVLTATVPAQAAERINFLFGNKSTGFRSLNLHELPF